MRLGSTLVFNRNRHMRVCCAYCRFQLQLEGANRVWYSSILFKNTNLSGLQVGPILVHSFLQLARHYGPCVLPDRQTSELGNNVG